MDAVITEGKPVQERAMTPQEFYRHPAVQQRIAEYCGGCTVDLESFSAEYLSGASEEMSNDRLSEDYYCSASRSSFYALLDQGADIFRAMWDRTATLGVLDVEYINMKYPAEAYFNPERVFRNMEPVYAYISRKFRRFGIRVLPIMTGQGYHFSFKVPFSSPTHEELVGLGKLEESLIGKYNSPQGFNGRPVPLSVGCAFDGMGRIMEYFSHLVLRDMRGEYHGMPVVVTDVAVGGANEAVNLDLSMYCDPLSTRDVRCPFSTYRKHKISHGKFGSRVGREVPILATLPRVNNIPMLTLMEMRCDFAAAQRLAGETGTSIPDTSDAFLRLIKSYRASKLYRFHRYFDSAEHDPPEAWPHTYDRLDLDSLPPCVAHALRYPNDNLLKPTNMQAVTRVLLRRGWHPKHIAGLIRSKFERDYGWGGQWLRYDAATRANTYVRYFAGLVLGDDDDEEDLNCFSHGEKGYCVQPGCGCNLAEYKMSR